MTAGLCIYVLRFAEPASLTRAFDQVSDNPYVASCSFELAQRQLRLLAPAAVAEPLVERFYLDGGLAWCSRHAFEHAPPV